MQHDGKVIKFGEYVEGYDVPVLNEREIRAASGLFFVLMFISLMQIVFKQNFLLIKYVITGFLTDFIIRVFISPRFSPSLIIGRLIVSKQAPEYVGAAQKRFAWTIGLILSGLMFLLLVIVNSYSIITGVTCLICLVFLFFESSFGICLGCLFYPLFYKNQQQICAGILCKPTKKQEIQRITWLQLLVIPAFIVYIIVAIIFFDDDFSKAPRNLVDLIK